MAKAAKKAGRSLLRKTPITDKWGSALAGGWQVIPNVLVRAQTHLGLDAVDVVVLVNMNMHWWQKGDFPFPRPTIIVKRMGIGKRTVERRIEKLVKAGLLERLLDGLVNRLQNAAAIGLFRREYHLMGQGDEDS
jgi:hypothetical protein